MDKMVVITFDSEDNAYKASKALTELHEEGSIALYAMAVIAKDTDGKVEVKQAADKGPLGTAVGMMVGAMVGLIGGPAGVAVGMASGALFGSIDDLTNVGIDGEFLSEVDKALAPGKSAVVAECFENWVTPMDSGMEALGGVVLRRSRAGYADELIERDIAATKADFAQLKAEYEQASDENKAKLQAKVDATKAKLQASVDRAKERSESLKKEADAKVEALEQQLNKASADVKSKYQERAHELKADYNNRTTKLKKSWELATEALT